MAFRVLRVGSSSDDFAFDASGNIAEFDTGNEAQAFAATLSADFPGAKWRVKRVLDRQWRNRERDKFECGHYQSLPWAGSTWWVDPDARMVHNTHYAHPSKKEPGMIAFTESEEQGMDNRKTRIKPGRYLERFFGPVLERHGKKIKTLAEEFARLHEPRVLLFATDADAIQRVYEHGPHSCMSSVKYRHEHGWGYPSAGRWPLDMHACRVYAYGDLQVAYITDNDEPKGRIVARALIWPNKKTHSRCYGDEVRLKASLRTAGYRFGAPEGAKVARVPCDGHFVLPYIDAGDRSGTGAMAVFDRKTYLELTRPQPGTIAANSTNGMSGRKYGRNMEPVEVLVVNCTVCLRHTDDIPGGELYQTWRGTSMADRVYLCEDCRETHAYYCSGSDRYFLTSSCPQVEMHDGTIWSSATFRTTGFVCAGSRGNFPNNVRINMFNGDAWSELWYEEHGFKCEYTGDHYPIDQRVMLADGHVVSRAVLASRGFTCPTCERHFLNSQRRGEQCVHCIEIAACPMRDTPTEERTNV